MRPLSWTDLAPEFRSRCEALRSPSGDEMILQENPFVEQVLPNAMPRTLAPQEVEQYRRPFAEPGESRRPTPTWPRQIPIEGEPADVEAIVNS